MAQQQDPPIVVTGGSITIDIDETIFTKNGNRHSNANKKIRRVEVSVDDGATQTIDVPNGKVRVEIHYGNP